ncbi:MAG TPA: hypothetical protein VGO47_13505 [Chlamydiales bacterium]|jgi:hypothetical protein|nr:hypothetical protein [Chlamydiales bacterium]
MVDNFRIQAIDHFGRLIPKSFDAISELESYKDVFGEENPPHPFAVHNLFRQCQLMPFLPWSFYMACAQGFHALVSGVPHNGETVRLRGEDHRTALLGWKRLYDKTRKIRVSTILMRGQGCSEDKCTHQIRLSFAETATYHIRSDAFAQWGMFKMLAAGDQLNTSSPQQNRSSDKNLSPCKSCTDLWLHTEKHERRQVWNDLPSYFDLPAWDALKLDV